MARPSLFSHRKFFHLSALLGAQYKAIGILEMIWRVGYESGNPYVGPADAVEAAVGWDGEHGACADALVEAGFLDQDNSGCLRIHDLNHHAPDYMNSRAAQEAERKKPKTCQNCGGEYHSRSVDSKFCSPACRTRAWRSRSNEDPVTPRDSGETSQGVTSDVTETSRDGSPAPAPAPAPNESPLPADGAGAPGGGSDANRPHAELIGLWNAVAERAGMVTVRPDAVLRPTSAAGKRRRRAACARLREHPDLEEWETVIDRIGSRGHCRGQSQSGWRADFEFLTRPGTFEAHLNGRWAQVKQRDRPVSLADEWAREDADRGAH